MLIPGYLSLLCSSRVIPKVLIIPTVGYSLLPTVGYSILPNSGLFPTVHNGGLFPTVHNGRLFPTVHNGGLFSPAQCGYSFLFPVVLFPFCTLLGYSCSRCCSPWCTYCSVLSVTWALSRGTS